jgi:uncharacterized protein YegP (UPF0339 family)
MRRFPAGREGASRERVGRRVGPADPGPSQTRTPKESCQRRVTFVKTEAATDKLKFEVFEDKEKKYRWHLKAGNGQIVAAASEGYKDKAECEHMIELIKKGAASFGDPARTEVPEGSAPGRWRPLIA